MKDLIQESYFILYDTFLKIVSKPLIPIDNIKPDDFFDTNKQKSISPYKFEISRVCNMLTGINAKLRYISSGSTGHFFKGVILNDIHKPVKVEIESGLYSEISVMENGIIQNNSKEK